MPIDASIPLRGEFYKMRTPLEDEISRNALAESKQSQQLNQLKLDEAKMATENKNALRAYLSQPGVDFNNPDSQLKIIQLGGGDLLKNYSDIGKNNSQVRENQVKTQREVLGAFKSSAGAVLANPTYENAVAQVTRFGKMIGQDVSDELAQLQQIGNNPEAIRQWAAGHALEADKLLPKLEKVDLGGTVRMEALDPVTGKVVNSTSTPKTITPGERATNSLGYARLAQSERHHQDSRNAPSLTEVVDPSNPEQMIRIDAKTYRNGGVGAPGVIGVSGKEPKAYAAAVKEESGKSQLRDTVQTLRDTYDRLAKNGGITSDKNSGVSNLLVSATTNPIGQVASRAVGTRNQTDRDVIASSRLQLLNAIKESTGMSSKALDSNTELKTWLNSLSDPTQSKEAVDQILNNIEAKYGGGSPQAKPANKAPATLRSGASVSNW